MKACSTQSRSLMINLFVRKRILLALKIACHVPAILPEKKAEYEYNIFFKRVDKKSLFATVKLLKNLHPLLLNQFLRGKHLRLLRTFVLWLNPLTPKISFVILLTISHTVLVMLVWRIWYWIA